MKTNIEMKKVILYRMLHQLKKLLL